tara:strand:+ start:172 stop:642 length:471 start_codon:yes stop_codon:yes gene_type:complete
MISLIAAVSENNVIGNKGALPWHLPRDFAFFKETTVEHTVVMGRKTFESIGRPLPNRKNIILTRQDVSFDGCTVVHSIDEIPQEEDVFVIGGAEIYNQFLPLAKRLYITVVHTTLEGDTYFPAIDPATWKCVSSQRHEKDEKNEFDITFTLYERRK